MGTEEDRLDIAEAKVGCGFGHKRKKKFAVEKSGTSGFTKTECRVSSGKLW